MRTAALTCCGLTLGIAAAMLAGCGGSQTQSGAPGPMPQSRAIVSLAERGGSWMLPDAKKGRPLYVSDASYYDYNDYV
jgi:hypothetical protein